MDKHSIGLFYFLSAFARPQRFAPSRFSGHILAEFHLVFFSFFLIDLSSSSSKLISDQLHNFICIEVQEKCCILVFKQVFEILV